MHGIIRFALDLVPIRKKPRVQFSEEQKRGVMKYVRLYCDDAGESHFEDVDVELSPLDYAPPAPPLNLSSLQDTTQLRFLVAPAGWFGD